MKMTKLRQGIAAIVAILLVIVMLAVANVVFGWNLPLMSNITDAFGVGQ